MIFKGDYHNGRKNGKGEEYYANGKILFRGEYLNGKRWNGKGYNQTEKKEYEIKNGIGKFIEYYDNNNIKLEGEYEK